MLIAKVKGTKVVLELAEGTQTISNVNPDSADADLVTLAEAVGSLCAQRIDKIHKVVETNLINV